MAPITRSTSITYGHIDPGPDPLEDIIIQDADVEMTGLTEELSVNTMCYDPISNIAAERIVIAIDFGTTFSSVAFCVLEPGENAEKIGLSRVHCISGFPDYQPLAGARDLKQDVTTELWYYAGPPKPSNHDTEQDSESDRDDSSTEDDDPGEQSTQSHFDDNNIIRNHDAVGHPHIEINKYWGYEVQHRLNMWHITREDVQTLTRIKLHLVPKENTASIRAETEAILTDLKKRQIITADTDIYRDFLAQLLKHTKGQLSSLNKIHDDSLIQFVLCVPAKWPVKACQTMQRALEEAVEETGLSHSANKDVCNLFMISEPEAAAECILSEAGSELYVS